MDKQIGHRQVILIPDETGGFTVEVPSLPGCISEGDTVEEALANIKDAIALYIESLEAHGEPVPDDISAPNPDRNCLKLQDSFPVH